jgi:site-specific recombinase XerD
MFNETKTQRTNLIDDYLLTWTEAFLIDRKARGMAKGTISFYVEKLRKFTDYCEVQQVKRVTQITPAFIREYLLYLETRHHPGSVHAHYRILKTFLFWWEEETEPENWRNPIRKVKVGEKSTNRFVRQIKDTPNLTAGGKRPSLSSTPVFLLS